MINPRISERVELKHAGPHYYTEYNNRYENHRLSTISTIILLKQSFFAIQLHSLYYVQSVYVPIGKDINTKDKAYTDAKS